MKEAAIKLDELAEKPLAELSAAQFLEALTASGMAAKLHVWPEKKKYELWLEENFGRITVGSIFKVLREKKKVELEKPPGVERIEDPRSQVVLEQLVDRVADAVELRLRGRGL